MASTLVSQNASPQDGLHSFGRSMKHGAAVFQIEQRRIFTVRTGLSFESASHAAVARSDRSMPWSRQKIDRQVAGDPEQPVSKPATTGSGSQSSTARETDSRTSCASACCRSRVPRQSVNERLVKDNKLLPRRDIQRVGQSQKKAVAGVRNNHQHSPGRNRDLRRAAT